MFHEYGAAVWQERSSGAGCGDGCTATYMCRTPWSCTPKTVKVIHFILCMFYYRRRTYLGQNSTDYVGTKGNFFPFPTYNLVTPLP